MRRIREVFRYHFEAKLSQKQIAGALGVARSTVWEYLRRLSEAGLSWEAAGQLSDEELEQRMFSRPADCSRRRPQPDWATVHAEMNTRRYMTLQLLWEEYRRQHADGYSYPRFCVHYATWARRQKVYMRQQHVPGEKLFVDYSGKKPCIRDRLSGLDEPVELLVMAWGLSQYLYAEAQRSQQLPQWIMGHVRGYGYYDCAPHVEVPDSLKSAVTKASLYDPDLNRAFAEMAAHYGVAVVPARPGKPRDKPKVENAVLIAQRWILAALRHRVFYSIEELNQAIGELLERANTRPMKLHGKSRRQLFDEYDRPNALPLPSTAFEYREWQAATLSFDCHLQAAEHFYSAPYALCQRRLWVRLSATTVEVFDGQQRVALHQRSYTRFGYTTDPQHLPEKHRQGEWSPGRLLSWASKIGQNTCELIKVVMNSMPFVQQGYRPALGILRLAKSYGAERLEAVAQLALHYRVTRVGDIENMLKRGRDKAELNQPCTATVSNTRNSRGRDYYAAPRTPCLTTVTTSERNSDLDTGHHQQTA
jgi:transposase